MRNKMNTKQNSLDKIKKLLNDISEDTFIEQYNLVEDRVGLTVNEVNQLFGKQILDENVDSL